MTKLLTYGGALTLSGLAGVLAFLPPEQAKLLAGVLCFCVAFVGLVCLIVAFVAFVSGGIKDEVDTENS